MWLRLWEKPLDKGKFTEPISGSSDERDIAKFANTHYTTGRALRVLSGGAAVGTATVTGDGRSTECGKTAGHVTLKSTFTPTGSLMALATTSETMGKGERARRAPTTEERGAALKAAADAWKGLPAAAIADPDVVNLTAIDVRGDGKPLLVGSLVARQAAARDVLFMLLEPSATGFTPAFAQKERFTKDKLMEGVELSVVGSGDAIYVERLADHVDVDGDGISEIVTKTNGFEGDKYAIYKAVGGAWKKVFEFSNYRCGF